MYSQEMKVLFPRSVEGLTFNRVRFDLKNDLRSDSYVSDEFSVWHPLYAPIHACVARILKQTNNKLLFVLDGIVGMDIVAVCYLKAVPNEQGINAWVEIGEEELDERLPVHFECPSDEDNERIRQELLDMSFKSGQVVDDLLNDVGTSYLFKDYLGRVVGEGDLNSIAPYLVYQAGDDPHVQAWRGGKVVGLYELFCGWKGGDD